MREDFNMSEAKCSQLKPLLQKMLQSWKILKWNSKIALDLILTDNWQQTRRAEALAQRVAEGF